MKIVLFGCNFVDSGTDMSIADSYSTEWEKDC